MMTQPESGWLELACQRIWADFFAKGGKRQKYVSALIGALATGRGAPGF